jgi:hypothetical protein
VIIRLEEDRNSVKKGLGRSMTIRAVASSSRRDTDDDEAVSPMAIIPNATSRDVTEPEPVHARKDAHTLEKEGVAATDYFFEGQNQTAREEKLEEQK